MYAQMTTPPPALTSRRPDLPPAADGVLARALAKAPEDRFASCREFADALRVAFGLQPYDSGPGTVPAPARGPTQLARPATPVAAPAAAQSTAPTVAGPGPGSAPTAAEWGPGPGPVPVAAPGSGGPPAGTGSRRRAAVGAVAVIAVLAVAGVLYSLLGSHGHQAAAPPPPSHAVPMSVTSRLQPVTRNIYVVYRDGRYASAQVHGQITGTTSGEVARLYAQQFPYSRAPVPVGSVILEPASGTASYAFTVTPTLATRYRVKLFRSSTANTPLGSSAVSTVYVTVTGISDAARTCQRPVCHEALHLRVKVPAAAMSTELAKQWYPYFAVRLAPGKSPAAPRILRLGAASPRVTPSRRVSRTEFRLTYRFSFRVGDHAYNWNQALCARDTEARDGIGLPGGHTCGDKQVLASAPYLG
jgi:hypothetical protein